MAIVIFHLKSFKFLWVLSSRFDLENVKNQIMAQNLSKLIYPLSFN